MRLINKMFFCFWGEGSRYLFHAPHNRPPWRRMWGRRLRGAYSTNTGCRPRRFTLITKKDIQLLEYQCRGRPLCLPLIVCVPAQI
jgi:hypothetical protein